MQHDALKANLLEQVTSVTVQEVRRKRLGRTSCQCLPDIDGSSASGFKILHNSFNSPSALPSLGKGVSASSCTAPTIA